MKVLRPGGPFILIMWDRDAHLLDIRGTLDNRQEVLEMLRRAESTIKEASDDALKQKLIVRPEVSWDTLH